MELPPALMPWRPYLELFPREIVSALGPLVQRLDLVIGPLRVHGRRGTGDPDGFQGITRRGTYERLLLSEWMLADELPDEFTRRAVMGEHGFLDQARQEPVGARLSIALFDAGPNQLGSPRIAHLAALIVLARRAAAVGAGFQWGILQQPAGTAHTSVSAGTVLHLLQARTHREATNQDIAGWRDSLGSSLGADDLWIIGGRRLTALPAGHGVSLLQISDPVEPQAHHLKAVVMAKGRAKPPVTLELPEDKLCARLLRDPFLIRISGPARTTNRLAIPTTNLLFAHDGTKLMARSRRECLVVYPIPNSPRAGSGKPKVYHTSTLRTILSVERVGKEFALVTSSEEPYILYIERVGPERVRFQTGSFLVPSSIPIPSSGRGDTLTPCFYMQGVEGDAHWLILVANCLLRPKMDANQTGTQDADIEMEQVVAASTTHSGCSFVGKVNSKWVLLSFRSDGTRQIHREFDHVLNAHIGFEVPLRGVQYGLVAVEQAAGEWTLLSRDNRLTLHPPAEDQVVGVTTLLGSDHDGKQQLGYGPGLIVLQKNRRNIIIIGKNWTHAVPPASSEIVRISASHAGSEIAYFTVQGELVVYSLTQEGALYRLEAKALP